MFSPWGYRFIHIIQNRTTVAAEQLNCITFVGPQGDSVTELKASYPLQLSVRIDESRKCVMFDCFEYKPQFAIDLDDPDLSSYYPTNRAWNRWNQTFMTQSIDNDDDEYRDDEDDDDYVDGYSPDGKMEMQEGSGDIDRDTERIMIFNGMAGNFAYSRCLRSATQQHCGYMSTNW